MGKCLVIFGLLALGLSYIVYSILSTETPVPSLPEDPWWGPGEPPSKSGDLTIRPFTINIEDRILTDLKLRLKLESSPQEDRLRPPLEGTGFTYGFNTDYLKTLLSHWLNKYHWRSRESQLNKYPQFKTKVYGLDIHFQHIKVQGTQGKKNKVTRPLLLLHGWPGSFVEFQKLIPLLMNSKDSEVNYELVIPSLPGYGFSEGSSKPGLGPPQMGQIFVALMKRLGHDKFYVQGGDWGALIGKAMTVLYPNNVMGYHSNMCAGGPGSQLRFLLASIYPSWFVDSEVAANLYPIGSWFSRLMEETGYFHIQATKPDTVGVALSNSPSGLAAYILEKFSTWTNGEWKVKSDGGLPNGPYTLDELLDNLMIYWVTNSITTSVRLYAEAMSSANRALNLDSIPIHSPTGCLWTPSEQFGLMNPWLLQDTFKSLVSFTKAPKGGHFAAFEIPELLAQDILQFYNSIENNKTSHFFKDSKPKSN